VPGITQKCAEIRGMRERSTDRNLPPIFTYLATKVESQEMWLPVIKFSRNGPERRSTTWVWHSTT